MTPFPDLYKHRFFCILYKVLLWQSIPWRIGRPIFFPNEWNDLRKQYSEHSQLWGNYILKCESFFSSPKWVFLKLSGCRWYNFLKTLLPLSFRISMVIKEMTRDRSNSECNIIFEPDNPCFLQDFQWIWYLIHWDHVKSQTRL